MHTYSSATLDQMDQSSIPANDSGRKVSSSVASALVSAAHEWMLMFMIFVDACFSYLITRFARSRKLHVPCLLCSRLDRVIGGERAGFYSDLICHRHKLKLSTLVLCQLHNKLVDDGTCESCIFSFAKVNESTAETYRSLIDQSQEENKCNWCLAQVSSQLGKSSHDASDQLLPYVEYKELKVASNAESEVATLDNKCATAVTSDMGILSINSDAACEAFPQKENVSYNDCTISENLLPTAPPLMEISSLYKWEDRTKLHHNIESETPPLDGFEALKLQQTGLNKSSKLVSFPVALSSPRIVVHSEEPKESHATSTIELDKEVHVEYEEVYNEESDSTGRSEVWKEIVAGEGITSRIGSDVISLDVSQADLKHYKPGTSLQMSEPFDLGDAYKLALGTKGRQLSGKLFEQQKSMSCSRRASQDLKLLLSQLSQLSAARGTDFSLNDISPRLSANDDLKSVDVYESIEMPVIQRRISLERNESSLSLDGLSISDIEGESSVNRLKREVEHVTKITYILYKELEEERNASTVAVNQAMAMISRLQEEKATLQMEALQCLRMMEEQAEYDCDALQKANDDGVQKVQLIQSLKSELEFYRKQFGHASTSSTYAKLRPETDATVPMAPNQETIYQQSKITMFSDSDYDEDDFVKRIMEGSIGGSSCLNDPLFA